MANARASHLTASDYRKLLENLNYVNNSIMMCDEKGRITYANSTFCKNFRIDDQASIIGLTMEEIMELGRTHITTVETDSSELRMNEVLRTGKAVLDWAVRIESYTDKKYMQIVSNDMFPTFDDAGKVSGLIEISRSQQQEIKKMRKSIGLNAEYTFSDIIGKSEPIKQQITLAKEFAGNRGTVLITGESGVGKEVFAQSIHNASPRAKGPFVALNCANFPAELIESELFGYVEGAFTGASKKGRMGKFELASGGTLFLDEIGELPFYFQSKLLRVLETWTITRVGGLKEIPIDVRLIAATNRNLPEMIKAGLFRQDLYYRLQVLTLELPPLRERKDDISLLAEHFLKIYAQQNNHPQKSLSSGAKNVLSSYAWPGNARELKNVMNRIDLLYKDEEISANAVRSSLYGNDSRGLGSSNVSGESADTSGILSVNPDGVLLDESGLSVIAQEELSKLTPEERINLRRRDIDMAYIKMIREALAITGGNKKEAANLLGISRKTVYRFLEKYNLPL